jgi:hypothetical protein
MTNEVFFGINRAIEWLVFNHDVSLSGKVIDGVTASRTLPAYASHLKAANLVIEHFEKGGATITFTPAGNAWECQFLPSPDDVGWKSTTTKDRSKPLALCLCVLKSARDILTEADKIPAGVAALLEVK